MKLYNIYDNDSLVLGSVKFGEIKAYFGKQVNPSKYIGTDKLYLERYRIDVAIERDCKRKRIDGKNNIIPFDLVAEWEEVCSRINPNRSVRHLNLSNRHENGLGDKK